MIVDAFWLAAGLAVIIKGGDLFVSASVRAAEFLRLPRVVIGSTLVSLATTSPEMGVSVMAGFRGEPELALGNAIGSCLCNTAIVLGVVAALKQIEVHPSALRVPLGVMLGLAVVLFLLTLDLEISRPQGVALLLVGAAYFAYDFLAHGRDTRRADVAEASAIERGVVAGHAWLLTGRGTAVQFLAGAVLVVAGSRLLVDAAVGLATALAVPSLVVGLTMVALGTSLPELVTVVSSARRRVSDLGIGNVLGANVANLSLVPGAAASIAPAGIDRAEQLFNMTALLAVMAVVAFLILRRGRISRRAGAGLLVFYALYLAGLTMLSAAVRP
jgi:cation:H+ antiporter